MHSFCGARHWTAITNWRFRPNYLAKYGAENDENDNDGNIMIMRMTIMVMMMTV